MFQQARAGAPSILFIDEIDSIVGSRSAVGGKQAGVQERVLSTLLNQMDGVGVKVDDLQRSKTSSSGGVKLAAGEEGDGDKVGSSLEMAQSWLITSYP